MFPARKPKPAKRASRWRSQAHCNFVRDHNCSIEDCPSTEPTEVAHVRMGSGAGMGQKPDDWRMVSLCRTCHQRQHNVGEPSFWRGVDVEALIAEFCRRSPKAIEIRNAKRERGHV